MDKMEMDALFLLAGSWRLFAENICLCMGTGTEGGGVALQMATKCADDLERVLNVLWGMGSDKGES